MWQTKHAAFVCLKLVCVTNEQSATWEQHHRFMRRYLTIQMKHSARHSVNRTFFNTCCCWIISRKHQACYPMICLYFIFLTHSNNAKRKTGCVNRIAVQSIFTLKFLTQPSLPWINGGFYLSCFHFIYIYFGTPQRIRLCLTLQWPTKADFAFQKVGA